MPNDLTAYQFSYIIRKRLKLPKEQSLWLFVNGRNAIKGGTDIYIYIYIYIYIDTLMSEVYDTKKDTDGFLYIVYSGENVYGK